MPLYEYTCSKCDFQFEEMVPYDHRHEMRCPQCGEPEQKAMFPVIGGYTMKGDNSASVRPKGAGSRPRKS